MSRIYNVISRKDNIQQQLVEELWKPGSARES